MAAALQQRRAAVALPAQSQCLQAPALVEDANGLTFALPQLQCSDAAQHAFSPLQHMQHIHPPPPAGAAHQPPHTLHLLPPPPAPASLPAATDTPRPPTPQKRLVLGTLVSIGLAAFALVPTKELRPKPSKPLFFYIVPLIRIQDLLNESKSIIEDANWEQLRLVLSRVLGTPNDAKENMFNCVAYIEDGKVAQKADDMVGEFLDYIDSMDYNKYFDAMTSKVPSGTQQAEFVKFSGQALKAAQGKLASFISLLPAEDVAAARQQVEMSMQ